MKWLRNPDFYPNGLPAVGLLFLRIFTGYAMAQHGLGKIQNPFGWMGDAPVPGFLQALAAASEFFGGIALIFGVLTPLACLGIMSTMFVAIMSMMMRGAPMVAPKPSAPSWEMAGLFFFITLALFMTGPGRLSVDYFLFGRKRATETAT
ncbi:MAG: DoxX family protein [Armatimonadetes bacterium]|nr:DoxX family protein [Armatimonadota bacterium]